jgi:hypothetical protein
MPTKRLATALLALLLVSGCATGFDAETQQQDPTGNGRYLELGDLSVQNFTLVAGDNGSAVLMKIFNDTASADRLIELKINNQAIITDLLIPANTKVAFGNATNPSLDIPLVIKPGGYLPVVMEFESAGIIETSVLVVAAVNQYQQYAN